MKNEGSVLAHLFEPKSEHMKSSEEFLDNAKAIGFPGLNFPKITEYYLKNADKNSTEALKQAFYEFFGDLVIKCPTYFFVKQFAEYSPKSKAYFYEWTHPSHLIGPLLGCTKDMGVCHASEIEVVFGLNALSHSSDAQFSKDVMKIWTNFAKYG